jgi:hypothetical protein
MRQSTNSNTPILPPPTPFEQLPPQVPEARRRYGVARQVGGDLPEAGVGEPQELGGLLRAHEPEDLVGIKLGDLEHLPDALFSDPYGLLGHPLGDPIRNKTDEQLQTRLLVAELPDYPGRVKHHSAAVSEQLFPDAAAIDYSRERWLWQEGLRQLTTHRRVVFPLRHPNFALDDDQISHGARLWANLLSLMAANAWLEQRNRRLLELPSGEVAIEATPDDYAVAYRIFTKVCKRTVINLSDTHRKILNSLYELHRQFPNREGFTQREIAKEGKEVAAEGRVSQGSISNNKTFLIMSAKLIKETEHGLALVKDAEPSWWAARDLMTGLPTPDQVRSWWEDSHPDPSPEGANHIIGDPETGQNPHTYAGNGDYPTANQELIMISLGGDRHHDPGRDYQAINEELISENGSSKGNAADGEGRDHVISSISGSEGEQETERPSESSKRRLAPEQVEEYKRLVAEGMHPDRARAEVLGEDVDL